MPPAHALMPAMPQMTAHSWSLTGHTERRDWRISDIWRLLHFLQADGLRRRRHRLDVDHAEFDTLGGRGADADAEEIAWLSRDEILDRDLPRAPALVQLI
jgi:hypothetical protein